MTKEERVKRDHLCYQQDGNEWFWWWKSDEDKRAYCTNKLGCGVFEINRKTGDIRQITGTCQFSVSGIKDPRAKIRRWMTE